MQQDIKDCLRQNYLPYAVSVIADRAIPKIDGFKPSHTQLLYTMYNMGLINTNSRRTKSANIVGQTMKLNPHGDASIYATMVRMSKGYGALNTPYIDSKGNFGKHYSRDMAYAASRYTEAKLMPISKELFNGIDKNAVDMIPNYDGTILEPSLLPVRFPTILTNVTEGIAVGIASKICSFNLSDVCEYTVDVLNNKTPENLIPDFPTGGQLIYDKSIINTINKSGRGSFKVRAKYKYDKENNCIDIYEIPFTTTCEAIVDKVAELVKDGKVKEISDIRDETDLSGLKITIDIKRNADHQLLIQKLFSMTTLEDSFSCNFNVLIDKKPQLLGVKSLVDEWIDFRKSCIKREIQYDIEQHTKELNKLQGLEVILTGLDKAISIIRSSKSEKEAISKLQAHFNLNQEQLDYIITIRLVNMNEEWLTNRIQKVNQLKLDIERLTNTLSSDREISEIIISQLQEVKAKYGKPRMTEIICPTEVEEITQEDLIEDYNCNLVLSHEGYVKKTLRFSDTQRTKDGDYITQQIPSTNKSKILFFTDKANIYFLNAHELDNTQPSTLGTYLYTLLNIDNNNEEIIYMTSTEDYKGYMLFGFENGKVAKVDLSAYETKTNRTKLVSAYNDKSKLISINYIESDIDIACISSIDKCVITNTELISSKASRNSQGNQVLKSRDDSYMSKCIIIDTSESEELEYYRVAPNAVGKFIRKEDVGKLT